MRSPSPLVVPIILLALPVLYVGSYLVVVNPQTNGAWEVSGGYSTPLWSDYRFGGLLAQRFFWPLEQLDRRLRPKSWASVSGPIHYVDLEDFGEQTSPER